MPKYDAAIIGAGIFGLATAFHILREDPSQKLIIIDQKPGPGMGNTGKSAAAFRVFFTSQINYKLSKSSVEYYINLQNEGIDLGLQLVGYLWLETEDSFNEKISILSKLPYRLEFKVVDEDELIRNLKVKTRVSNTEEGRLMGLKDIYKGIYVPMAGFMEPDKLVEYYFDKIKEIGCHFAFNTRVIKIYLKPKKELGIPGEPFIWQDVEAGGVITSKNEVINADKVIIAAGAWTNQLLDAIGIDAHVKPKKRQIFVLKAANRELSALLRSKGFNDGMPFTILPSPRIYIRPEFKGSSFWISYSDDLGRPFEFEEDPKPEISFYTREIYQVLINYFPQFKDLMPYNMWAGHYVYSTIDKQPIIYENKGIIIVTGGSGSGIMKGDAVGRIAAALYMEKDIAKLYGGISFPVDVLGVRNRKIEEEKFVL